LATVVGIRLLDRLRGAVLREQAARWESAGTLATTGDLAGAAGGFRPPPTAGRRLPAIGPRPLVLLYARRDAIAWLRSPERLAAGVLAGLVGAALLAVSTLLAVPAGTACATASRPPRHRRCWDRPQRCRSSCMPRRPPC